MSAYKAVSLPCVLLLVSFALAGCPTAVTPPDTQLALVVSPQTLDFGTDQDELTFNVAKVFTSREMPPFTASANKDWLTLSPTTGVSTGPLDPVPVTATIDRSRMSSLENSAEIVVSAEGLVPKTVQVSAELTLVASFTSDTTLTFIGKPVQFVDQSIDRSDSKAIVSWEWDFGDGSTGPERFEQNPTHVYTTPGTYTVSLTVSDGTLTHTYVEDDYMTILPETGPVADFTGSPRFVISGESVQFFDQSNAGSEPITSWLWDFGDTGDSDLQHPLHVYMAASQYANYTVSLTVTTAIGSDTEVKVDYIGVTPSSRGPAAASTSAKPNADIGLVAPKAASQVAYPWNADFKWFVTGAPVQFLNLTQSRGGDVGFLWNFGDGTRSAVADPVHAYRLPGVGPDAYWVSLTASNPQGSSTSLCADAIHVFGATVLDQYVRGFDPTYDPGLPPLSSLSGDGFSLHLMNVTSQTVVDPSGRPLPLVHSVLVAVPDSAAADWALLVLADASDAAQADDVTLGRVAADTACVTSVLCPAPGQPEGFMPAVKGVVRAMDAIQQLTAGEGSVSSFVVAGAGESAWTAWLVAAVDQRVRAVVPAGIDPGAARGLAIADIEDLGIYEARVQVPLLDANDSSAIDARVAEGYLLGTPAP